MDSRQEVGRDGRPIASQGRVYVREESKEIGDPQLQAQASYRSGGLRGDERHMVGVDQGYPAPRVATATSRDALGEAKPLSRQRY